MVRAVITPTKTSINLSIPQDYVGKPIEITFLALEELEHKSGKKTMSNFRGVISDETAEVLHQRVEQSRKEW